MKKIGALVLTAALAGSMTLTALAEEPMLISPNPNADADTGYAQTIVLNGETLDLTGIPGGTQYLPMRLVAEADHGSAYWAQEENQSWFTFGDNRIIVSFADNSVTVNDVPVADVKAEVSNGVTFLPADVLTQMEGYTVETSDNQVTITTPNNDPMVKLGYQVMEDTGVAMGMRADKTVMANYGIDTKQFESYVAFFPMITSPDTVIVAKLAENADVDAVKDQLEAYRKSQEDTFSWYLSQNLPKVQDARVVVEGDYLLFLIGENADAGVKTFTDGVASLEG